MGSEEVSIKSIIAEREEHDQLQKSITFLKMENLEFALKCNRMENAIKNIEAVIAENPKKLSEASENLCGILLNCRSFGGIANHEMRPEILSQSVNVKGSSSPDTTLKCKKGHAVKPHMVNGTVLHIPTINLTRVSDRFISENLRENNSGNGSMERNDSDDGPTTSRVSHQHEMEAETSSSTQDFDSGTFQGENVAETSESRSPSHSTVLSGTFQEVKIFLNQINPDSLQEHSRKSQNLRRHDRASRSSINKKRSSGCITKRKRS